MPRKPSSKPPKAYPLQVRLDPHVLERVRALSGDEGSAAWIRRAVDEALERIDQASSPQPKEETPQAPGLDLVLAHLAASADDSASRDAAQVRAVADLRSDAAQIKQLLLAVSGVVALMARPLGILEKDIGRLILAAKEMDKGKSAK